MARRSRLWLFLSVLAAVAAVAGGIRLAMDPLAAWRTRRMLAGMQGMRGTFQTVHVRVAELSYEIRGLRIEKLGVGGRAIPYFEVQRARLGLSWKELLRGHLVAGVELVRPELILTEGARQAPSSGRGLEAPPAFRIERAEVRQGEVRWIDAREPDRPELRGRAIEATLENLATRPALANGQPTVVALSGSLGRTGQVSIFLTADPFAKRVTFAGRATLQHLELRELGPLLAAKTELTPQRGTFDLFVRFRCENGRLSGLVRPFVRGAELKAAKPGAEPKLKEWIADASLQLFSEQAPGREGVATAIPIEGTITDPKARLVPAILGVLRNSFVKGLESGLRGGTPPEAKERKEAPEQARRASSAKGGEPRAPPREDSR